MKRPPRLQRPQDSTFMKLAARPGDRITERCWGMGKHKPAKTCRPACWRQHTSQRLPGGEQVRGRQVRRRREGEVTLAEGESKGDGVPTSPALESRLITKEAGVGWGQEMGPERGPLSFISSCTLKAMGVTRSGQDFGNTPATWTELRSSGGESWRWGIRGEDPSPRNRRQGFTPASPLEPMLPLTETCGSKPLYRSL